jgi:hypothetical protein
MGDRENARTHLARALSPSCGGEGQLHARFAASCIILGVSARLQAEMTFFFFAISTHQCVRISFRTRGGCLFEEGRALTPVMADLLNALSAQGNAKIATYAGS